MITNFVKREKLPQYNKYLGILATCIKRDSVHPTQLQIILLSFALKTKSPKSIYHAINLISKEPPPSVEKIHRILERTFTLLRHNNRGQKTVKTHYFTNHQLFELARLKNPVLTRTLIMSVVYAVPLREVIRAGMHSKQADRALTILGKNILLNK